MPLMKKDDGSYEVVTRTFGNTVQAVTVPWTLEGVTRWESLGAQLFSAGVGVVTTLFLAPKVMKHAKKNNPSVYAAFNKGGSYDGIVGSGAAI